MLSYLFILFFQAYRCLSFIPANASTPEFPSSNKTLTRRVQVFHDCSQLERIMISNLLTDTILPMVNSAERATSPRGWLRRYHREKLFQYWGTFSSVSGLEMRESINEQLRHGVSELERTPRGRIGIYCRGEQLEDYCHDNPRWLLYGDRRLNEVVLVGSMPLVSRRCPAHERDRKLIKIFLGTLTVPHLVVPPAFRP